MVGSSNDQLSRPTRITPLVTYVGTGQETLKKNDRKSKFSWFILYLHMAFNYNVYHTCDLQRNANPQPYIQKWGMQIAPHRTIVFMVIYIYIYIYTQE